MKLRSLTISVLLVAACGPGKTDSNGTDSGGSTGDTTTDEPTTSGSTTSESTTSDSTTPEPTTGSTTVEATSTGGVDLACDCMSGNCGKVLCYFTVECKELCDSGDMDDMVSSEADVQCALEALRDRTPGQLSWFLTTGFGAFEDHVSIAIRKDGTAIVKKSGISDLCSYDGPDQHAMLREPDYFEGCLAQADPIDRFNCLTEPLSATLSVCAPYEESCDEDFVDGR